MANRYKIRNIKRYRKITEDELYKAKIASIFSTAILAIGIATIVVFSSFEPIDGVLEKSTKEAVLLFASVLSIADFNVMLTSIFKKVTLKNKLDDLDYELYLEEQEQNNLTR